MGLVAPMVAFAYVSPGRATGLVNDFASVLSVADKTSLEQQLTALQQQTSAEIAVAIVPTVGRDETIETYAVKLFEEWGVGQKGKDNGALILVAIQDREMRIEVGYGMEGIIPDATAFAIVQKILTPKFAAGDFAGGLREAVTVMGAAIAGDSSTLPSASSETDSQIDSWAFFYIFFLAITLIRSLFIALARTKSWWLGGVLGGIGGGIIGLVFSSLLLFGIGVLLLVPLGLIIDYFVSRLAGKITKKDHNIWWGGPFGGGRGGGGFGGGGFGGFGGGGSGGGGASGRW